MSCCGHDFLPLSLSPCLPIKLARPSMYCLSFPFFRFSQFIVTILVSLVSLPYCFQEYDNTSSSTPCWKSSLKLHVCPFPVLCNPLHLFVLFYSSTTQDIFGENLSHSKEVSKKVVLSALSRAIIYYSY